MDSRRSFLQVAAAAVARLGGMSRLFGMDTPPPVGTRSTRPKPAERSAPAVRRPVITPDVKNLPYTLDNGTKVFQLVAEPVKRKIVPWKTIDCWGFNGSCPGPTIQVNQGDQVRIVVENRLPESFAIHWHGLEIPYAMDKMGTSHRSPSPPGHSWPTSSPSIRTARLSIIRTLPCSR
jgi:manganese oxidase